MKRIKLFLLAFICGCMFIFTGCDFFGPITPNDPVEQTEYVTVTFDGANSQRVEKGKTATKIADPEKEGYDFLYWTLNDEEFNFNTKVNENINLISKFEKKTFTVKFDIDGTKTEVNVAYGEKVTKPNDPEKEGYDFVGFVSAGKVFDFNTEIKQDYEITAKFEIKHFDVKFVVDGETVTTLSTTYDNTIVKPFADPTKEGYTFKCWMNGEFEFDFDDKIRDDITLTACFEMITFKVTFVANGAKYKEYVVEYNKLVIAPTNPTKTGNTFVCWKSGGYRFDFNTPITSNITLTAEFITNTSIVVEYDFGYDCYQTKADLRYAFYSDFYNFMLNRNVDFSQYNITNLNTFLTAMDTWTFNGRNEMAGIGDAFGRYYVKRDIGGTLENQPETVFIGWCYKNNKYIEFIHHLETFFAYWRTDEGYSQNDPNGNDFYASPWASMVDTGKFFYFTSDNLQSTYGWFDSERVHYALDHIPGVGRVTLTYVSEGEITLPTDITRKGYMFVGWYDANGTKVEKAVKSMKVTAHWEDNTLEDLAKEFLADFNTVNKKSFESISDIDTAHLDSSTMVTFGSNAAMTTKWMWLYKALADVNNNTDAYPDRDGFKWADYKGFYLANICGFFTQTQHTDTYLKTVSADFTNLDNVLAVLGYDKVTVKFMVGDTVYKVLMVDKGAKVTKPEDPTSTQEGYVFAGWKDGTNDFDFNVTSVGCDIVLTASFRVQVFKVEFLVDGNKLYADYVNYNEKAYNHTPTSKTGYTFVGWMNGEEVFDFNTGIKNDLTLVAKYEVAKYTVTFKVDNTTYDTKTVEYNKTVTLPNNPTKAGYTFVKWKYGTSDFVATTKITRDITLTAEFSQNTTTSITVQYDFGYDCYQTKEDLRVAYYTDFYNFMVAKNVNFSKYNITDVNSFLTAMDTWKFNGVNEMGGIGNAFGSYYLVKDTEGKLSNQPETTFLGWCYKNNKYLDLIAHLETFFAYWRTDEGYTTSTNHGNEFYYDSWAAMVDTAKFFHFTGDNLQDTYSWFDSERVHYALDHIPGVGRVTLTYTSESEITLPQDITRKGYTFIGWFNEQGTEVETVSSSMKVIAHWENNTLGELEAEFMADFNQVNGKSYANASYLDTSKIESSYMVTFGNNATMTTKWMWLYKAIADLNNRTEAYPDSNGFSWDNYKGFYLANICGLFTRTQHTDTYLKNLSADYSDEDNVLAILNYDKIAVKFNVDGQTYKVLMVEENAKVTKPADPIKEGYNFVCWKNGTTIFDFNTPITEVITLTAVFEEIQNGVNVKYNFGYDCYQTKADLRTAYYTDFYNFLVASNYDKWNDYEIENLDDFLEFMMTFKYNDRSEMGTIGTAFGTYYVSTDVGGKLEDQPETVFVGWCYKNNKYVEFIHHLETFFAYWRTDEGYSKSDPNGNDFYASPWASMVDTAKFFYFNGDTLNTNFNGIYSWFDSDRVDYALDHIPGVGRVTLQYNDETQITLPTDITRDGYTFKGWVDVNDNPVTVATSSMTVYAKWEKSETIVYTVRAEAKSNLTSGSETNWYCATPSQTQNGYLWGHRLVLVADGENYKVSEILTGNGQAISGDYAYRIVHFEGAYQAFDEAIKVGQKVTATVDGNYIIFNFYG